MNRKLKIGVVFGGRSGEHEVSLVSATSVMQALDRGKYDVIPIGITPEGRWVSSPEALRMLKEKAEMEHEPERFLVPEPTRRSLVPADAPGAAGEGVDVIFPLIHGTYGEDGTLQGLLELADLPYVGAGVLGSALGMDKIAQKLVCAKAGIPVARYVWFPSSEYERNPRAAVRRVERALTYPLFVKPANTGSSVGITKAHTRAELLEGIAQAARYDRRVIVEQGIRNAREIECAVLGNDEPVVSVPGEILPSNEFYDYDAKYVDGKSQAIIPARLPRAVTARLQKLARLAYTATDCAGMARADFFVTRGGQRVVFNELNTLPGFTSISMYPKLWEASGLAYGALLDRLIELALERHREKGRLVRSYRPDREWYRG
jgi:D-alanine-D-alanine ligase